MVIRVKYTIFLDLEGTLLNDNKEINSLSVNYLKELSKFHTIFLVSNMAYNNMNELLLKYDLDVNIYSSNDGIYKINNKVYYDEISCEFINEVKDGIYTCFLENKDYVSIINYQERLKTFYPNKIMSDIKNPTVVTISIFNDYFDKLLAVISSYKYSINIIGKDAKKTLLKISKNGLTKGNFAYSIIKETKDKIIAVTDQINDKDLIDLSDIKIAMKNSDDEVIKHANIIIEYDNNNDGCMIEIYNLIKKITH